MKTCLVRQWRNCWQGAVASLALMTPVFAVQASEVLVYKDPSCGCCVKWVEHMRQAGFTVKVQDEPMMQRIKQQQGIPQDLGSCHTALVDGFIIEGHVPADVVKRLLKERPNVSGLSVPGMPMGSPGMEGPTKNDYEIVSFGGKDDRKVFDRR